MYILLGKVYKVIMNILKYLEYELIMIMLDRNDWKWSFKVYIVYIYICEWG